MCKVAVVGVVVLLATALDCQRVQDRRRRGPGDDAAAAHTFLRDGADPAEALRQTTIHELRVGRGVPVSIRFHAIGARARWSADSGAPHANYL